ncbi:MAG TPA: glycosyltransferase [Mycobacteriales bacterium]
MYEVEVPRRPLAALAGVLTAEQADGLRAVAASSAAALSGRTVWNVNSTATGGGVAEMLRSLLGYVHDAGVRSRWLVLSGDPLFFALTKRLHNAIHGADHAPAPTDSDRAHYEEVLAGRNLPALLDLVGPRDVVILHDPQAAGLVVPLRKAGIPVIWRCHIGRDTPNATSEAAWDFLRPYVEPVDAAVFSRRQYAPAWLAPDRISVIPPSIDPLSEKNRPIDPAERLRILLGAGLLADDDTARRTDAMGNTSPAPADARLVVQVSRWDRLKDMPGVIAGFAKADVPDDVHLMLVGPDVTGVVDDPEGGEVLAQCLATWQQLPGPLRDRVHLASVPMADTEQNARIVNAIQRHAAAVAQKSLAEGFGLTVAEAMWKSRPVVASDVGGIQDQIHDGHDGLLITEPRDLDAFGDAVARLLADPALAQRLGDTAHETVRTRFLGDRHLEQYAALLQSVLA